MMKMENVPDDPHSIQNSVHSFRLHVKFFSNKTEREHMSSDDFMVTIVLHHHVSDATPSQSALPSTIKGPIRIM